MTEEIDKGSYELVVKERDYERTVNARLRAELIRAKVRLRELGVGALLSVDAQAGPEDA